MWQPWGSLSLTMGGETFVRRGLSDSVLDLSFASPKSRSRVLWCLEPDSLGSNHIPIHPVPSQSGPSTDRPIMRPSRTISGNNFRSYTGLASWKTYQMAFTKLCFVVLSTHFFDVVRLQVDGVPRIPSPHMTS